MISKNNRLKRKYHPYWDWEEVGFNMWGRSLNSVVDFNNAVFLMKDYNKFKEHMQRVASEWTFSCEHNLSNVTQNRIAWLGQAACAIAFNCPAEITRKAWQELTDIQKNDANLIADKTIKEWESKYAKT